MREAESDGDGKISLEELLAFAKEAYEKNNDAKFD
jgi:Ca2+-binding EF-hand superfamily protein